MPRLRRRRKRLRNKRQLRDAGPVCADLTARLAAQRIDHAQAVPDGLHTACTAPSPRFLPLQKPGCDRCA
jgi:hypothetical protein